MMRVADDWAETGQMVAMELAGWLAGGCGRRG